MEKRELTKIFATLDTGERIAFFCVAKHEDTYVKRLKSNVERTIEAEQEITFKRAAVAFAAMLLAPDVSEEIRDERRAICATCPMLRKRPKSEQKFCNKCHCNIGGSDDLTSKAENLPHWGCKHPQRGNGKGWKR